MVPGRSTARKIADLGLIVLFVGAVALPVTRNLVRREAPAAGNENRSWAGWPELKWEARSLDAFPTRVEQFYNDHFGCRYTLIHALNVLNAQWLKLSTSAQVVIGKDGWLFYVHEAVGQDYQTARPFTPTELARWEAALRCRRDWLAARGIPYLFVIAPDKQSVYPEELPRVVRDRGRAGSLADQLLDHLRTHTDVPILDLRDPLRQAKCQERLYALTDSHWNDRGAYVAYCRILEALATWFPQARPWPRAAFAEVTITTPGGDLARMVGLDDRMPEHHLNLVPRVPRQARRVDAGFQVETLPPLMQPFVVERPHSQLGRAVMLRDSFAGHLIPYLSEHFQRTFYLWQEPNEFNTELIEREHPDVVIQEIAERKIALHYRDVVKRSPR